MASTKIEWKQWSSTSTTIWGSTSVSPGFGSAIKDGSLLLLVVNNKPSTATPTTPSNWNLLVTHTGGTGTDGENTGKVRTTIFWKLKDGNNDGYPGTVSVSIPGGNSTTGEVFEFGTTSAYTGKVRFGTPQYATADDTTNNTSVSYTGSGTLGWSDEDLAVFFGGMTSYAARDFTSTEITSTGATYADEQANENWSRTSIGNNNLLWFVRGNITGTATGAPSITATASGNTSGPGIFLWPTYSGYSTDSGAFTEDEDLAVNQDQDFEESDAGTFSETENVAYVNADRDLSDSDIILAEEGQATDISIVDSDSGLFTEMATPFIDSVEITFNNSLTNPGYDISINGLIGGSIEFDSFSMFRRDPLGRYPDEYVRGMHDITVVSSGFVGADYEAPLGVDLDYYLELDDGSGGLFTYGPIDPSPTYIPTQPTAYGGGVAYIKSIDDPARSRAVGVADFPEWSRSSNVLAQHHVLGRRNPVVVTDVLGGREGSFTLNLLMPEGQEIDELNALINSGGVLLFQNNNYIVSGFKDMYFRITGNVSYKRLNNMVGYGPQQTSHLHDIVIQVTIDFTEVDRPDTLGVVRTEYTWQDVLVDDVVWSSTATDHDDWQDVADG